MTRLNIKRGLGPYMLVAHAPFMNDENIRFIFNTHGIFSGEIRFLVADCSVTVSRAAVHSAGAERTPWSRQG